MVEDINDQLKYLERPRKPDLMITLHNINKAYEEHHVNALENVNLSVARGEFLAIMGPSGCGKSTLLNIIGTIDQPDSGKVIFEDKEISALSQVDLSSMRAKHIGFVFQFFNLLSTLTAEENIALPLQLQGKLADNSIKQTVALVMQRTNISHRASFYPATLSGGEMQRVATARAIVHKPSLIIADEPTGNLDTENGQEILSLLHQLCKQDNLTIIMATHSIEAAQVADRIIHMKDGKITG